MFSILNFRLTSYEHTKVKVNILIDRRLQFGELNNNKKEEFLNLKLSKIEIAR